MPAASPDLQLFSYFRSSCSYRVRIALAYKDLAFTYQPIHLVRDGGEHLTPEYRQLNPQGEVPFLKHGSFGLSQSMAIIEYLDEVHPKPPLFGGDAEQRARIRRLCEVVNAGIQPLQNLKTLQYLVREFGLSDEQKTKWAQHWISSGLQALEKLLTQTHGRYCVGEEISAADCFLIPQVYNARRFAVAMEPFPLINQIYGHCTALPCFVAAHPDRQPDTPG